MYNTYEQFKKADRRIRKAGKKVSDVYLTHVKMGLTFFHGEGNHNIQIINDLLDTASAHRLQRNRIIDWLYPLVGHTIIKATGGRVFIFGGKEDGTDYAEICKGAARHFEEYPDWYAFKKEAAPEEFEALSAASKLVKRLKSAAETFSENHYSDYAAILSDLAFKLEVTPVKPDQSANDEPEQATEVRAAVVYAEYEEPKVQAVA